MDMVYIYMLMTWHEIMVLQWWLRSTMSPYGRNCIEVAYRETMIHFIEVVLGDISSRRVVEVSSWCISTWSTFPSQHQCWALYMIFSGFHDIRIYMYYVFKIYMYYKRNTGGLWLHPGSMMLEKVFDQPMSFKIKGSSTNTMLFYYNLLLFIFMFIHIYIHYDFIYLSSTPSSLNLVDFCYSFPHWARVLLIPSFSFFFFRLSVGLLFIPWWTTHSLSHSFSRWSLL